MDGMYNHLKVLILCCLALAIAIALSVLAFNRAMHYGHPMSFPPSDPRFGFHPGPDSRGTMNIIWACLSTIFTCVYFSLHLNVPEQSGPPPHSWVRKKWWWLKNLTIWRKTLWMIGNLIAPEVVAFVAIQEYYIAKAGVKHMHSNKHFEWTLTHAFFAEMGGFETPYGRILKDGHEFYKWFRTIDGSIDYERLLRDINNASNADSLLKAYTCLQVLWLLVQTAVRAADKHPMSELELTTCAYVMCTVITYGFWWKKPYNVQSHVLVHVSPPSESNGSDNNSSEGAPLLPLLFKKYSYDPERGDYIATVISGCIGAAVGAIHCGLWNATFANSNGQLLWRMCCILQITLPLLLAFYTALAIYHDWGSSLSRILTFLLLFIYFCTRVILFQLVGFSFWSLPAGVYTETTWLSSAFPHWH